MRASAEDVSGYRWWHSIDLGTGQVTPGLKSAEELRVEADRLFQFVDLRGKSFLDVGARNGGFSVEAARRGAAHVAGLDHGHWQAAEQRGLESYRLVARRTGQTFTPIDIDLDMPGLTLNHLGCFDVVLFAGTFEHLVDPLAATRELAKLARVALILETGTDAFTDARPSMAFRPTTHCGDGGRGWWVPNAACVTALLTTLGFASVHVSPGVGEGRQIFHALR